MKKLLLLIGAIFGTVAAFLFAPRSGKDTRNKLMDEIKKGGMGMDLLREDAKKVGKDFVETVKEIGENDEVKKLIKKGKKSAKDLYKRGKKEVQIVIKEGKKKVEEELGKGKKTIDRLTDKAYSFGVKENAKLKKSASKKRVKKNRARKVVKKVTKK